MAPFDRSTSAIAARLTPISIALIVGYLVAIVAMWATSHGLVDMAGRPLGTDFSSFWTAGKLALAGTPAAPYDPATHFAAERAFFGADAPFYPFPYPPLFLAVPALLASLPYLAALVVWQAATIALYIAAILRIIPDRRRETLLVALAFPAVFVNLTHGQTGFLTAGLFGVGLAILDRRPVVAGVLFGLLAYKPQFGVLLPFVLVATGRWRCCAAAATTVAAMAVVSFAAFGAETWEAFRTSLTFTREVALEQGDTGWHKIMSAFAAARALGASVPAAYALQAALAFGVLVTTVRLWRGAAPFGAKAAALLAGSLLITPYSLDYDLMILAPAIAFLVRDALAEGFRRHEALVLTMAWSAPLVARQAAELTLIPVGLIAAAALFALAVSRGAVRHSSVGNPAYAAGR